MKERGRFIVFEGIDCAGKSTQATALVENFRRSGTPCELIHFPKSETPLGYLTCNIQHDPELISNSKIKHLLYTANRLEYKDRIQKWLMDGKNVICDRYVYSGLAYSMANGLDREWCRLVDSDYVEPDLVIYMRIGPECASHRTLFGSDCYETIEFLEKVDKSYFEIWNNSSVELAIIDGVGTFDSIHQEISRKMFKSFEKRYESC